MSEANGALNSLLSSGVVGAVAVLAIIALWVIMNRRDEENKAHRVELTSALQKKDQKLEAVMETALSNNTAAMNSNAEATRENTRVLREVPCVKGK